MGHRRLGDATAEAPIKTTPSPGSRHQLTVQGWLLPRHPGDAVRVLLAGGALVITAVFVHHDRVSQTETDLFRLVNDLPAGLTPLLWPIMQAGNIVAVPVAALAAAAFRRFRLAVALGVGGGGVWLLAKVAKTLVIRGRPEALLGAVHVYGPPATGLGYPSGHSAVAFTLATLLSPYLERRLRRAVWIIALTVCLSRVYVGAHLPLDVVGGAALGWGTAAAAHLLFGAPADLPSPPRLRRALADWGFPPAALHPIAGDRRRSASFALTTDVGERFFVKVVPRERRDSDLVYRGWRRFVKRVPRSDRAGAPAQQSYLEAAMALLAAAAGARVPPVVAVGTYGTGSGMLVSEWIDARPIDALPIEAQPIDAQPIDAQPVDKEPIDAATLTDAWRQLARLQTVRLAHGNLLAENILMDADRHVWLVDFHRAAAPGRPQQLRDDITALLRSLATFTDLDTAAAAARDLIDRDSVDQAVAYLSIQPMRDNSPTPSQPSR
jgi:glycosyltransferase 2 family protein